jgi:hypothetical protein
MGRVLQLLEDVVVHFVTGGAELLVTSSAVLKAPHHPADETAEREKSQAQMRAWAAGDPPEPDEECLDPLHGGFSLLSRFDEKHVLERARHERLGVRLLDVTGGAEYRRGVTLARTWPSRSMKWMTLIIGAPEPSVNWRRWQSRQRLVFSAS